MQEVNNLLARVLKEQCGFQACLAAARTCLDSGLEFDALNFYARGLCSGAEVLRHKRSACLHELELQADMAMEDPIASGALWCRGLLSLWAQSQPALVGDREFGSRAGWSGVDQGYPLPILIIAGGAASFSAQAVPSAMRLLNEAMGVARGTVISGGTLQGVPRYVGDVTAALRERKACQYGLVAYVPGRLPSDAPRDRRYDDFRESPGALFSPAQALHYWADILAQGMKAIEHVRLIGMGGGNISRAEYCIALAMGVPVFLVENSGGAADAMLHDPLWQDVSNLRRINMQ